MGGNLEEVKPGMVLADAVCDGQGRVLLPAGTVLTPAQLVMLGEHGVARLAVVPDAHGAARIARLFRHVAPGHADAWASAELRRYVTAWRAGGAG